MHRDVDEFTIIVYPKIAIAVGHLGWKAFISWDNSWSPCFELIGRDASAGGCVCMGNRAVVADVCSTFGLSVKACRAKWVDTVCHFWIDLDDPVPHPYGNLVEAGMV